MLEKMVFDSLSLDKDKLKQDAHSLPAGSRLLRQELKGGAEQSQSVKTVWGVPWSPDEFLAEATRAVHPMDSQAILDDGLVRAAYKLLSEGPEKLARDRALALRRWTARRDELEGREQALHQAMDPKVRKILEGKKLLLMAEMAKESGHPDEDLASDIAAGFRITGHAKDTKVFKQRL